MHVNFQTGNERGRAHVEHPRQDPHHHRQARLEAGHAHHVPTGGRPGPQQYTR